MPSEFEAGLLPELVVQVPDMVAEYQIQGRGKNWLANLYSKKDNLVIEACSRNVVRTGKTRSSIQHYEKFYSTLLKLIDIKTENPKIRPIMIWKNFIPAHSTDLRLCTVWGVFVMSYQHMTIKQVLAGQAPASVNKVALSSLIRRSDSFKPRWRWLVEERKNQVVELLKKNPMSAREIANALGLAYDPSTSHLGAMLRELIKKGEILRLTTGYVRGQGAVYGVKSEQLSEFETKHFAEYKSHRRRKQLSEVIVQLLMEEGPMKYKQVQSRLESRWRIQASREEIVGVLSKRLRRQGLVKTVGAPKHLIYSLA